MQRVAPSRDTFTSLGKQLNLAEMAKLAVLNKEHQEAYEYYLNTVLFQNADVLLHEIASLNVPEMSRFLVKYSCKLNVLCDAILRKKDSAQTMTAIVIKLLVMNFLDPKFSGMTPKKLADAVDFVTSHGFPEHFIETIKFQQKLIENLAVEKKLVPQCILFAPRAAILFRMWLLKLNTADIVFYKNFRGVDFAIQSPDNLPEKFWWYANLLDANMSNLSCGGNQLKGAHINFSYANFAFILHNYYEYKFIPEVNYFEPPLSAGSLKVILDGYAELFFGENKRDMASANLRVKMLLYSTRQDAFDKFHAVEVTRAVFHHIQPIMAKQLLSIIAGIDARNGYTKRLELLDIALNHRLFAKSVKPGDRFISGVKSLFGKQSIDCQKMIREEIAKYVVASVNMDCRAEAR